MDMTSIADIIARLRGTAQQPAPPGPQLRGWQLANQERQMNGQPPIPYEEWVKTATPVNQQ